RRSSHVRTHLAAHYFRDDGSGLRERCRVRLRGRGSRVVQRQPPTPARLQDDPNSQLQTTSCNDMSTFKRNLSAHGGSRRQRGAALVVGLILLMVLTVLAISGMNTSTLELQMAGNT